MCLCVCFIKKTKLVLKNVAEYQIPNVTYVLPEQGFCPIGTNGHGRMHF